MNRWRRGNVKRWRRVGARIEEPTPTNTIKESNWTQSLEKNGPRKKKPNK